jgi:hypothetical protein
MVLFEGVLVVIGKVAVVDADKLPFLRAGLCVILGLDKVEGEKPSVTEME